MRIVTLDVSFTIKDKYSVIQFYIDSTKYMPHLFNNMLEISSHTKDDCYFLTFEGEIPDRDLNDFLDLKALNEYTLKPAVLESHSEEYYPLFFERLDYFILEVTLGEDDVINSFLQNVKRISTGTYTQSEVIAQALAMLIYPSFDKINYQDILTSSHLYESINVLLHIINNSEHFSN